MILLTGGTGFIGQNLVKSLLSQKKGVRVLCRDKSKARAIFPKSELAEADLVTGVGIEDAMKGVDTVIHLAGLVSYSKGSEELERVNVQGTKNLLDKCSSVKRIVFASSVSVYGETKGKAGEEYALNPESAYGESKLEAETLVKDSKISHVILRIAPIYGAGSPSWKKNLQLMEKGFPIPKTSNKTHIVHISEVVQALELSISKGEGIYNIAGKEAVGFMDLAEGITVQLGLKPKFAPMLAARLAAKMKGMDTYLRILTMNREYDISKARKELGYIPTANLEKEIKAMVEWYKYEKDEK